MSIEVSCDDCGKRYKVPDSAIGKTLRCKNCGAAIFAIDDSDPFDDSNALMATEENAAPQPAQPAPYLPPPAPRPAVSSKTILLSSAAGGGLLAIVGVVLLIVHFTGSGSKNQSPGGARHSALGDGTQAINAGTTLEDRLAEIWNLYTQYAAAHDGRFPTTLQEAGHPELRSGIDSKRGINFDLGVHRLDYCKSPLPAKMIVAFGLGLRDASGNLTDVVLFGDGQIQTLDKQAYQKASEESGAVEVEAMLWLAADSSTPRGVAASWFVAMGMGNAQALKNLTCKVDERLLDAMADQKTASRDFLAAAVARFPSANNAEPRPPKTQSDLARGTINIMRNDAETITGETAKIGSFDLKKIDGAWRLDARPFFDSPTQLEVQVGILILQINARATREVTAEISQGKYANWPAVKDAALARIKTFASIDEPFQTFVKAHRGDRLPAFAMVDPWGIQQDGPALVTQAPVAPRAQGAHSDPVAAVRLETSKAPTVPSKPAATVPDATPILPDPKNQPEPRRTELAGGNGGGPVETRSPNGQPIAGFRYVLGRWGKQAVVQRFEPIFQGTPEKPAPADNTKTLIARDGYVVGGLVVDFDDTNVIAVRVIFAQKKGDQIDAKDKYLSPWIGTPAGKHQQQLAGNGETIIGTFGKQGLNVGALGLLMPSNLRKTALLGGDGGGPFTSAGDGEKLVLGFRYTPGNWNGPVIGHLNPLYDAAGNDPPAAGQDIKTAKNILARDGYAVGGLIADFDNVNFFAFRVIFLRQKDGHLDPKDQYTSDWIGTPSGKRQQQLAGNGEEIIGIFGRQGLNCDAIGLLEKLPQPASTNPSQPK